jgi:hypothetical protein
VQCNNYTEKLTMSHIAELQWKLTQARNENQENRASWYSSGNGNWNDNYNNNSTNYKSRTASITNEEQDSRERRKQRNQRDVIQLFDEGYNVDQVAYFLEGHVSPSEVARIAEYNEGRLKFLSTGRLSLPGGMVGISVG